MNNTELHNAQYKELSEKLYEKLENLENMVAEDSDDPHYLFNYYVADTFEGIKPETASITDGNNDNGIDFYVCKEDRIIIYQCKLPKREMVDKNEKPISFNADSIKEISSALTFLTDEGSNDSANRRVKQARTEYRTRKKSFEESNRDSKFKIEIIIAIFGNFTPPAWNTFQEMKRSLEGQNPAWTLKARQFDDFSNKLNLNYLSRQIPQEIQIRSHPKTMVTIGQWGYCLVEAKQFLDLFKEYQLALFDLNVRFHYIRSSVNKEIEKTLGDPKRHDYFHLLNNGITISCDERRLWGDNNVTLINPQIINGCQTVVSIHTAYQDMSIETQNSFDEKCLVPVRIIATDDQDLLSEIVIATNNQNKMEPRNLLSSSSVQRNIQRRFEDLSPKWFYQRKDEEFASLERFNQTGFRPGVFSKRIIDNQVLAKCWLSFIGFSSLASENIKAFEKISESGHYEWLFEKSPKREHWNKILVGPQIKFEADSFDNYSPSPQQYLLSYFVYNFMRYMIPNSQKNKAEAIQKLKDTQQIDNDTHMEIIEEKLNADQDYTRNKILLNMKEVLTELTAIILIKRYGELSPETTNRILKLNGFRQLNENPNFKQISTNLISTQTEDNIDIVPWVCFQFLSEVVERWTSVNLTKYLTSQRRIRFLHEPTTISDLKNFIEKAEIGTKGHAYEWKPPNKTFIESLPELPVS